MRHFGFALDLSDIDLWNIDLLDTHLDLLDTISPVNILFASKTSSRRLGRRKIVTLKTCWRRLQDISWRRLQDVLKTNKCLLGSDTNATWVKNFDFDNYTRKNMFTHPYIFLMASERLHGEEQFGSKNYLLEMPRSHAKCVWTVHLKN